MSVIDEVKNYSKSRAKEIEKLAKTSLSIDSAEANIAGQKIILRANVEKRAAWRLYVEISTRVATSVDMS